MTRAGLHRRLPAFLHFLHDVAMAAAAFLLSLYLRLGDALFDWPGHVVGLGLVVFTASAACVFLALRLDRGVWRYASIGDLRRILHAVLLTIGLFLAVQFAITRLDDFPRSVLVIAFFVLTALLAGPRLGYRVIRDRELAGLLDSGAHRRVPVLLIGAGDEAETFIREMARGRDAPYAVTGMVDAGSGRVGREIRGVRVLGGLDDLERAVAAAGRRGRAPERLVLADGRLDGASVRAVMDAAGRLALPVSRMPQVSDLHRAGPAGAGPPLSLRPVALEDLLGRPQAVLDRAPVARLIAGQSVLITGAGGTIGGELARQLAALAPRRLLLLDASEHQLYQIGLELAERFPDLPRADLLADIRDRARIEEVVGAHRPDILFHAAALKHVPLVEANPVDGVLTNVIGTRHVAEAADRHGVATMVLISTDKAVNPASVMGATKRLAEALCQALDVAARERASARFVTVRFGNVLGSTGSVIPLFQRQLARGGPLTVTHPDMTRYFMTVREAVELVLQASALRDERLAAGGRICVLDMGEPVRIADLAEQMIRLSGRRPGRDVAIAFTGLRPGEKLREELFHQSEALLETGVPAIRLAAPRLADPALLWRGLDALAAAARARDTAGTLDLLARLVPELAPGPAPDAAPADLRRTDLKRSDLRRSGRG